MNENQTKIKVLCNHIQKTLLNNWMSKSCLRWAQVPHCSKFWLHNITTSQLHTYQDKL